MFHYIHHDNYMYIFTAVNSGERCGPWASCLSLLLQCKFANSTLLSLLGFSYFITSYDAQASSAFSALIFINITWLLILHNNIDQCSATQDQRCSKYIPQPICPGTHDFAIVMCTANCEGFYGTPSTQIFMFTATKSYVYICSTYPYLLHCECTSYLRYWFNMTLWVRTYR